MSGRSWNDTSSYLSSSMERSYGYGGAKQAANRGYSTSYSSSSGYGTRTGRDFPVRQKPSSLYESIARNGYDEGRGRDQYGGRASTLSGSWRSRSSEPYIRDGSSGTRDYSTTGIDSSLMRNHFRDCSTPYRTNTQPEDYSRIRSTGRDPYPLPPAPRKRSPDLHSILVKPSAQSFTNFNKLDLNTRTRSRSFLDINESSSHPEIRTNRPKRHQTLTFGVSENDLERARSVISSSSRMSNAPRDSYTKRSSSRHSLPDAFDGLTWSTQDYGCTSLPYSRPHITESSRSIPHSNSAHVSFLSPVESEVALPSFSSSEETSQDVYPSSLSPMYPSPSLPQSHPSPPASLSLHTPNSVTQAATQRGDETLKLLQKHYMDAILTLTPQKKPTDASDRTPTKENYKNDQNENPNSNQPMPVLDEILKLWEASQAENNRLKLEMNTLRLELESTKSQLDSAFQATNNSVSDTEKEEKQAMEKKLDEMEEKIKGLTVLDHVSDESVAQLQADNSRLREENAGLIRVMTKLSAAEE